MLTLELWHTRERRSCKRLKTCLFRSQAYFNVAMNQRSTGAKVADTAAAAVDSIATDAAAKMAGFAEAAADSIATGTADDAPAVRARSQLERGSTGYTQQFMDRMWTKTSI